MAPGAFAGRTVLVAGGAGAVGHAAIQLARWAGATVITTVVASRRPLSPRRRRAARGELPRPTKPRRGSARSRRTGVDLVVEVSPAKPAMDVELIRPRGRSRSTPTTAATSDPEGPRDFATNVRYQCVLLYTVGNDALQAAAEDIKAAIADGALPSARNTVCRCTVSRSSETADAHDAVEGGRRQGAHRRRDA